MVLNCTLFNYIIKLILQYVLLLHTAEAIHKIIHCNIQSTLKLQDDKT